MKNVRLIALMLSMLFIVSCGTYHTDIHPTDSSLKVSPDTQSMTDNKKPRPSLIDQVELGFRNPQIIYYDDINPNAVEEWAISSRTTNSEQISLGAIPTVYYQYIAVRETVISDQKVNIQNFNMLFLKVRVVDFAAISIERDYLGNYSDGSVINYNQKLRFTFVLTTVTGIIDAPGLNDTSRFNVNELIGQELAIKFPSCWYYDDNGVQKRLMGSKAKNQNDIPGYVYIPDVGEEIIVSVQRHASKGDFGFGSISASDMISESQNAIQIYNKIKQNQSLLDCQDILDMVNYSSMYAWGTNKKGSYGFLTLFSGWFTPSVDLNNKGINNQEEYEKYLKSLDEYFKNMDGSDAPLRNGYYGTYMPPEINVILRDICV